MLRPDLHEDNRIAWNAATQAHNSHKRDQAAFLRKGGSTLFPEEIDLRGGISGKRLLHLQCNAGQDSLSLAPSGYEPGVQDGKNPHPGHEFRWILGEIATALTGGGLAITNLREYPYSNGAKMFDRMRETPGRRMLPPEDVPDLPLMFGIVATPIP